MPVEVAAILETAPDGATAEAEPFVEVSVGPSSMCASSVEETPRGAGFLLDPNRLNVAISRARCLAIVVASTTLVRARPNTVKEMDLLNLFCRLRYYARHLSATR